MWNGDGPLPMTFRVAHDDQGEPQLRRCLLEGDPDSDRFRAGYDRQLGIVNDLLAEGQAANGAGAHHHAGWTLKAADVVLAQLRLALVDFQAGGQRWQDELFAPSPAYDPATRSHRRCRWACSRHGGPGYFRRAERGPDFRLGSSMTEPG
jgi:hypothetical protein